MAEPSEVDTLWEQLTRLQPACVAVSEGGQTAELLQFDSVAQAAQAGLQLRQDRPDLRLGLGLRDAAAPDAAPALLERAGPGEFLASEAACDRIAAGLDAEIGAPLHALDAPIYCLTPAEDPRPAWRHDLQLPIAMPVLMLLPLRVAPGESCDPIYAELLHYGVQRALSQNKAWHVISRQSSEAFRHHGASPTELRQHCRASHVATGTVSLGGRNLCLDMHVVDSQSGAEVWRERVIHPVSLVRWTDNPFGRDVLQGLSNALMGRPWDQRYLVDLPGIESYLLLFSAMALMHRRVVPDFERSRQLLLTLAERHPETSEPYSWLAKWHVMRVARRLSRDVQADTQAALAATGRALARGGDRAMALAIDGHVRAYLGRDFDAAEAQLQAALAQNPSESLAWLYLSAVQVYQGRSREAASSAQMARLLSPLDPMRYYYDGFAAHALLAAEELPEAIVLAQRSATAFPAHVPTLLVLAIARGLHQQEGLAAQVVAQLRHVEPGYCLERFRAIYPGAATPYGQHWAETLRRVGLPERA